jgi:hypothetical protein
LRSGCHLRILLAFAPIAKNVIGEIRTGGALARLKHGKFRYLPAASARFVISLTSPAADFW